MQTKVRVKRKNGNFGHFFEKLEEIGRSQSQLFLTNASVLHNGTYTCIARWGHLITNPHLAKEPRRDGWRRLRPPRGISSAQRPRRVGQAGLSLGALAHPPSLSCRSRLGAGFHFEVNNNIHTTFLACDFFTQHHL